MDENTELTVTRSVYYLPFEVTGVDDQGRQTGRCPQCGGSAYVRADGRVICSEWEPIMKYLSEALRKLMDES